MSFSCQKGEFDRFFNRLDRPVEESRPDRQPDRPVIAVGGGGAGGAVAPPFGSKRRKSSKIRANGLFIWANSVDIWAHHCQNTVSVSVKTIFFFGEHLNLGRKNRLNFDRETQCIKSFFGQNFAAPPNHFELLRSCGRSTRPVSISVTK